MKYPIVKIIYLDPNKWGRQAPISDAMPVATIEVVGFLIREDSECVWIAHELFTDKKANLSDTELDVRGTLTIPKGCIKRRRKLN